MKKLISFVLPIHNEAENIYRLCQELEEVTNHLSKKYRYEYIFVNDGSQDNSYQILLDLHNKDPEHFRLINLARNFGHQIAVTAGQDFAEGDVVIIMDTDLQDPPEVCLDLIRKWEDGYEIVYAQRNKYRSNFFKEISAYWFYRILHSIAEVNIPIDTGDFRLLDKKVNLEMRKFREKSRFLRGITSLIGFRQTAVKFDRSERYKGKPSYTFFKSLSLAINGITGFSKLPLRLITIFGIGISVLSLIGGFCYIFFTLWFDQAIQGWASLMAAIFFLGGMQMIMLGIIGEYIGRIYLETLDRPLYTIRDKVGFENSYIEPI